MNRIIGRAAHYTKERKMADVRISDVGFKVKYACFFECRAFYLLEVQRLKLVAYSLSSLLKTLFCGPSSVDRGPISPFTTSQSSQLTA